MTFFSSSNAEQISQHVQFSEDFFFWCRCRLNIKQSAYITLGLLTSLLQICPNHGTFPFITTICGACGRPQHGTATGPNYRKQYKKAPAKATESRYRIIFLLLRICHQCLSPKTTKVLALEVCGNRFFVPFPSYFNDFIPIPIWNLNPIPIFFHPAIPESLPFAPENSNETSCYAQKVDCNKF